MAQQADIHELYEESVQAVDGEIEFLVDTFKSLRKRDPISFREDFCGTASACCEWVGTDPRRHAVGVDIDEDVLEWGRANRVGRLPEADRARVKLLHDDVMDVTTDKVDVAVAFNFSYFFFKTRDKLRTYFSRVREALNDDGLFFLDCFGGSEALVVQKEKTKFDDFTYVWDQAEYEPVTNRMVCHIHFKFPDGSKLKKAFSYEWRLWSIPELRELLEEAGFSKVRVYWEGEDEEGEANGEFTETATGEPDPAWVAYIVAEK
ncbi:MAG: class I SAM-dependent methyltransferase [Gammaproteobacteria bacterium]|nr:class I SAM-dependent methyltransferase [Gammaproteobacteria bacterium]